MALLNKIEKGELSFDDTLTYSYDRTGTVQISKDYDLGAKLSIRLLIEYLIYYSDNVAFSLLLNQACSLSEFRSFCKSNYGGDIYKDGINQLTASVVAKAFEDLYHKSKTGNEIYVWYVEQQIHPAYLHWIRKLQQLLHHQYWMQWLTVQIYQPM